MIATRRAPNGASRALSSLARSSRYAAPHPSRFTAAHRPATTSTPRFSSTTTPSTDPSSKPPPPPSSTPPPPKEESQQQQPKKKRSLRPLIYSTLFLGAGLVVGNIVRFTVAPPPLPDAGTEMDEALQGKLREELDRLPVVREFAAKVAAAADAGGEAEWVEVEPWGVGMPPPSSPSLLAAAAAVLGGGGRRDSGVVLVGEEERKSQGGGGGWFSGWGSSKKDPVVAVSETLLGDEKHMVSQTLAAMKGYGPARRWVNRATRESVTVFWVGGGLSGWPGVAHGGALATAFCEAFGTPSPAKLTLTYLAPTMASNFFVLEAAPSPAPAPSTDLPPQKDMTKRPVPSEERPADGGEEWSGTLRAVQGRVCVKATAVVAR